MQLNYQIFLVLLSIVIASQVQAQEALRQQKESLLERIKDVHKFDQQKMDSLKKIYFSYSSISQGNPGPTKHPVSRKECLQSTKQASIYDNPKFTNICKDRYMAPLHGPMEPEGKAKVCIDQFEFPNIPCDYPVVWARATTAHQICEAVGKRLCDASEWEQACSGSYEGDQYVLSEPGTSVKTAHRSQRKKINAARKKVWAYGFSQDHSKCGTNSAKSSSCNQALQTGKSVWKHCGSNTYPSGYFPECKSSLGVYDQHGNAAEHMNLPLFPGQLTREGSTGHVEMKGSWFIFKKYSAHPDDCLWRAPYWHGTSLAHPKSHQNYHLGFRCCKSL
ncbi:MAG: SUMF1/EgtB/PvdO family nonheme iron enzyme [Oligoflexales bacterium]